MNDTSKYIFNPDFKISSDFEVSAQNVLEATLKTNEFLVILPETLYKSVDFKTMGAVIGAIFCDKLAKEIPNTAVNPIEKGHPDIIPIDGLTAQESILRNYPTGIEIKGTIGNIRQGTNLRAGQKRISELTGVTWQAHHKDVNHLLGFLWDFEENINGFLFPNIVAAFYSDQLLPSDWGEISGITGRNTKVTAMVKSGKEKMGNGWVLLLNKAEYLLKIERFLHFSRLKK